MIGRTQSADPNRDDHGRFAPGGGRRQSPGATDWRTATLLAEDDDGDRAPAPTAPASDGTARGDAIAARVAERQREATAKAQARADRRAERRENPGRLSRMMGRGKAKAAEEVPARVAQADQAIGRGVDNTAVATIGGVARKVAETVDKAEVI